MQHTQLALEIDPGPAIYVSRDLFGERSTFRETGLIEVVVSIWRDATIVYGCVCVWGDGCVCTV